MAAWDGWLGSLTGTLVGAVIALAATVCVARRARDDDRAAQAKLLEEQAALARRSAASEELANFARAVARMTAFGSQPRQQQSIMVQQLLAFASAFRIEHLLGDDGHSFAWLLTDGIEMLGGKVAAQSARHTPASPETEDDVAAFGFALIAYSTFWLETAALRSEAIRALTELIGGRPPAELVEESKPIIKAWVTAGRESTGAAAGSKVE